MNHKQKQVVLISGATSGIGQAIGRELAKGNFKVYGTGRNVYEGEERDGMVLYPMDVTDERAVQRTVETIIDNEGGIDVLVSNAGRGAAGPLETFTMDEVRKAMDVNYFGALHVIRAVLPHMRAQKSGRIIQISSISGAIGLPFQSLYCSSKFAIEGVIQSLRTELSPFGIQATLIEPGDFNTNVHAGRMDSTVSEDSPYAGFVAQYFDLITANVKNADDPRKIGRLVSKLLKKRRMKPCYRIGPALQIMAPLIKRLLPWRLYEKQVRSYYRL
ncbi:SDR family oxidoreductase [Marinilabiliaceae bacterium JC017]|nr:SDR family oxidoreductase [Marinilabiliaceae bacterium JC017]